MAGVEIIDKVVTYIINVLAFLSKAATTNSLLSINSTFLVIDKALAAI